MTRRYTSADYHARARDAGLVWLGPEVPNAATKTRWLCPEGHIWEARYSDVGRYGCATCGNARKGVSRRLSSEQYHTLAARREFVWLGPEVKNNQTKTRWRCAHGHDFDAAYNSLASQESGCPICSGNQKKTAADYHALAARRGIEWIGRRVETVHTRTRWRCPEGHEWLATYRAIDRGTGCPCCAGHAPRAAYDYAALGERRGFIWLGPMPATTQHRTNWQCTLGHVWSASFNNIDKGSGCPHCREYVNGAPVSQRQRGLHRMLGGYLNYPVNRYRIDVALITDKLMIAVEYDSWYFHDSERDAQRDQTLLSLGWRVLRIKSGNLMPSRKALLAALERVIAGERCVELELPDWEQHYGVTKRV